MSCWEGHVPRMNEDQMRQAVNAYFGEYDMSFMARWQQQQWAPQMEPKRERPPRRQSWAALPRARGEDKVGAIDAEFVRVR